MDKFCQVLRREGGQKQLWNILKWQYLQNCCFLPFVKSKLGSQDIVFKKLGPKADFGVFHMILYIAQFQS